VYVERMPGGVRGGGREAPLYSISGGFVHHPLIVSDPFAEPSNGVFTAACGETYGQTENGSYP
jgi:hypothetical protein